MTPGEFPTICTCSLVTLIPKKTNGEMSFNYYRTISNLSFLFKLVEKAYLIRQTPHLNSTNKFPINTSAYKPLDSTETLLTKVNNNIRKNLNSNKLTLLVLLELSAAFDMVDQKLLLNILDLTL